MSQQDSGETDSPPRNTRRCSFEERVFSWLLLAYPREFRDSYGPGMLDLFRIQRERAKSRGTLNSAVVFWFLTLRDLLATASAERLECRGIERARMRLRSKVPVGPSHGKAQRTSPNLISRKRGSPAESLYQDTKHAVRRLLKSPAFTATTMLIVALGIGANTAIFSIVDAFLFRPPPFERPEELVWIYQDSDDGRPSSNSYPAYLDMAAHENLFSGVTAMINGRAARHVTETGETRSLTVSWVTSSYFPVLGLSPSRGRWLEPVHDVPGGEPVAVVSHRAWQNRFGGEAGILGRQVRLNGATVTLIGVGPEGYDGALPGVANDFWLSLSSAGPVGGDFYWRTLERRQDHWFLTIARLRPGVSVRQAQAAMNLLAQRLAADYPDLNEGREITVMHTSRVRVHPDEDAGLYAAGGVLLAVAILVLVIACGNLANLLLARASTRGREIAVRLAIGATRGRLIRHLLVESLILSITGGAVGVLFAFVVGRVLQAHQPPMMGPLTMNVSLDWRVLAYAFGLSVVTGIVFGLAPAIRASRPDLVPSLKDTNESLAAGQRHTHRLRWLGLRNILVMVQVAVSMVLLVGAGLLVRSLMKVQNVELGYTADRLAMIRADAREAGYEPEEGRQFFLELRTRVAALPGVQAAGLTTRLPTSPSGGSSTLEIEGYQPATGTGHVEVIFSYISPEYLEALGVPIQLGRGFTDNDRFETERVALVNRAFAERYWGTQDVIGRRYRHQGHPDSWVRIVGVVADFKVRTPDERPTPIFFRPLAQSSEISRLYLVARTAGDPSSTAGMMHRELRALDSAVPVHEAGTMRDHVSRALALQRAAAGGLAAFGGLALLLASMGLYAVVAFAVSQRKAEMGIRVALGASGGRVFGMVVKEMMVVVGIGVAVGMVLSLLATPAIESLLFDTVPGDPLTLTFIALLLVTVALAATWLPASRAARADPMSALRAE